MARKILKGHRTMLVNAAVVAIPILDQVAASGAILSALTPHAGAVIACIGILNMILRAITDTPVGKKEN